MNGTSDAVFAGEGACLLAAVLWAVSITLLRAPITRYGAQAINLFKCSSASILQGLTVLAFGYASAFTTTPLSDLGLVAASGVVGLTIGDTALFAAVSRMGAHRTMLIQSLAPVFTVVFAAAFQGERLSAGQLAGAACVLAGVALVVHPRRNGRLSSASTGAAGAVTVVGVAFALLAALGQGSGVVLAKAGMDVLPALPASFLRLSAAAAGLVFLAIPGGGLTRALRLVRHREDAFQAGSATFLGTYIALFLMMAGVAFAPASIAAVLLSTTPVFILVVERVVDGRAIPLRAAAGSAMAVAGVAVLVGA